MRHARVEDLWSALRITECDSPENASLLREWLRLLHEAIEGANERPPLAGFPHPAAVDAHDAQAHELLDCLQRMGSRGLLGLVAAMCDPGQSIKRRAEMLVRALPAGPTHEQLQVLQAELPSNRHGLRSQLLALLVDLRPGSSTLSRRVVDALQHGKRSERAAALDLMRSTYLQLDRDMIAALEVIARTDPVLRPDALGVPLKKTTEPAYIDALVRLVQEGKTSEAVKALSELRPALAYSRKANTCVVEELGNDDPLANFGQCHAKTAMCWVALDIAASGGTLTTDALWERWGDARDVSRAPLAARLCGATLDPDRWGCEEALIDAVAVGDSWTVRFACRASLGCLSAGVRLRSSLAQVLTSDPCNRDEAALALAVLGPGSNQGVLDFLQGSGGAAHAREVLLEAIGRSGDPVAWTAALQRLRDATQDSQLADSVARALHALSDRAVPERERGGD